MGKHYYLVNDETTYAFDEVKELIREGKLVKKSLIWEESLPEWAEIYTLEEFREIFEELARAAEEHTKRALGEDEESLKKREMREMLQGAGEEIKFEKPKKNFKPVITGFIALLIIGAGGFAISRLLLKKEPEKKIAKKEKVEKLNIEKLKFASGVTRLEKAKGIKIRKVTRSEEDQILAEAILEMKEEERKNGDAKTAPAPKQRTGGSLFEKVSQDELNAFRKKLLTRSGKKPIAKKGTSGEEFFKEEEKLSASQLSQVIKKHSKKTVRFCYNRSLKIDSSLSGKLEVTIHILGNGKVAKVVTETQKFKGTNMERCVKERIKKNWVFPSFNGTMMTVSLPFILSN